MENWRRGRDSNPRYSFPYTRFPSVLLKPLGHLSNPENSSREFYFLGGSGTRPRLSGSPVQTLSGTGTKPVCGRSVPSHDGSQFGRIQVRVEALLEP